MDSVFVYPNSERKSQFSNNCKEMFSDQSLDKYACWIVEQIPPVFHVGSVCRNQMCIASNCRAVEPENSLIRRIHHGIDFSHNFVCNDQECSLDAEDQ